MEKRKHPPRTHPAFSRKGLMILAVLYIGLTVAVAARIYDHAYDIQMTEQITTAEKQSATQVLYVALDHHMQVPYLAQHAIQTSGSSTVWLDATSDFSSPSAPNTQLTARFKAHNGDESLQQSDRDLTMIGTGLYALLPLGAATSSGQFQTEQWYFAAQGDTAVLDQLDPYRIGEGTNTPLGQLLVGNFTPSDRQELMRFIRQDGVYTVSRSVDEKVDGIDTHHIVISINAAKLDQLNDKAAAMLAIKNPIDAHQIMNFDAWITTDGSRFKKVTYHLGGDAESTFAFDYLTTPPAIAAPENFIEVSQ